MTWPGIEPKSPGQLENSLPTRLITGQILIQILSNFNGNSMFNVLFFFLFRYGKAIHREKSVLYVLVCSKSVEQISAVSICVRIRSESIKSISDVDMAQSHRILLPKVVIYEALRCGTRPNEWCAKWDSYSLV